MIKYSWTTLSHYTKNDPHKVFDFFNQVTTKKVKDEYVRKILLSKANKTSYILNNVALIQNELRGSKTEILQYVYLASKRTLADYIYHGILWIPEELCDINIVNNRLLTTTQNKIHFKYEELCQ